MELTLGQIIGLIVIGGIILGGIIFFLLWSIDDE